jgi:hypothetical protein
MGNLFKKEVRGYFELYFVTIEMGNLDTNLENYCEYETPYSA